MSGLTPDQLDFYRTEGYLLVEDVVDPSVFDLLITEINAHRRYRRPGGPRCW